MRDLIHKSRFPDLGAVISRFPVAVLLMATLTAAFMIRSGYQQDDRLFQILFGTVLGGYACVIIQLVSEARKISTYVTLVLKIAVAIGSLAVCILWEPLAFLPWVAVLAAILFLGNAAFLGRARDDDRVWLFTQTFWTGAIFAAVGSIAYTLGIMAIWGALDLMFGMTGDGLFTRFLLPVGLALLAPLYWLGTIPRADTLGSLEQADLSFEARALAFLGTWILAPLTLIYALIVIAYGLRILLTFSLPEGRVAYLVSPFLAVGTLTWLVLEPRVVGQGMMVRLYRRVWFPVALAATLLLVIAVGERVSAYGWTAARFALAAIAAASLIIAGWFTFSRRRDIRIPTAVAAAFAILTAFVAQPLSDLDQMSRLRASLGSSTAEGHQQLRDSVRYLNANNREDWVRDVFPDAPQEEYTDWNRYLASQGYNLYPEASLDAADWRNLTLVARTPTDLSATPNYAGKYVISIDTEGTDICSEREFMTLREGRVCFTYQEDEVRVPLDLDYLTLFRENAIPYGESKFEIDQPVTFSLPDGRNARVLIVSLGLNGDGNALRGGYGEALLFTE